MKQIAIYLDTEETKYAYIKHYAMQIREAPKPSLQAF